MDELIKKLENLKKWNPSTGDSGPFAWQVDWDEDNEFGCWIRLEDIEEIIKDLKSKNP